MITIKGTAVRDGIAIAVAALVDPLVGLDAASPALLRSGVEALKRRLPPEEYPEAVVVCSALADGLGARIPGVRMVGIAAQEEVDPAETGLQIPCVAGLRGLLKAVGEADPAIVIVDGRKGIAFVDPDPATLTHYQHIEAQRSVRAPVFIAGEHLPAKTQSGETVLVFAYVRHERELENALNQGADGVLLDLRGKEDLRQEDYVRILTSCVGKRVSLIVDYLTREVLCAIATVGTGETVGALFPADGFEQRLLDAVRSLESAETEAFLNDLEPPQVTLGVFVREECPNGTVGADTAPLAVAGSPDSLPALAIGRHRESVTVILDRNTGAIAEVVAAGARSVAVAADLVAAAKYTIRSIPSEENP